ncbi:hypothetical protein chiPu_0010830 [Chiloscyllium punctatum]|uniref:Uncharacterized protein n=1 Tax=Chiloscyllium punctatum TaxID=137246 RepID=A0A401SPN7_CHIPU|nr:hypothetical protein [Chiloscyllium punctatum]
MLTQRKGLSLFVLADCRHPRAQASEWRRVPVDVEEGICINSRLKPKLIIDIQACHSHCHNRERWEQQNNVLI